jgi:hypothetical protein
VVAAEKMKGKKKGNYSKRQYRSLHGLSVLDSVRKTINTIFKNITTVNTSSSSKPIAAIARTLMPLRA